MNKFTDNYEPSLTGLHSPVKTTQLFVHELIHGADPDPLQASTPEETTTKSPLQCPPTSSACLASGRKCALVGVGYAAAMLISRL